MNADKLAERIVKEVGGKNNIKEMFHCVTRLRFYLKDRSVVDEERIKKLDGVLGVQFATDQLQIIIGNEVGTVYNAIINKVGFIMDDATAEKKKKMRIGGIFETISAIILPVIPAMAGTGILKGIITIMTSYLGFDSASALIKMMTIAADCVFYFLPFFIAWSAAKRFKTDTALALMRRLYAVPHHDRRSGRGRFPDEPVRPAHPLCQVRIQQHSHHPDRAGAEICVPVLR